ncbi:uncharacterized protein LOC106164412 [Lingula anatina]|uniref:Uncharacterized protein LOC106164412 n=1 Tax=Lingula anatina TaxID=7574 RepID=A0A1S3IJS5_LINAN|nr:uncharacterized protein LOC106164412 [Lingula anatina]|eukprot:XP_013397759.1 uncharacterized protein LOC106164412 [Lingula anatina]
MCYKLFSDPKTWDGARQDCQDQDGDLMVVQNTNEIKFISDSISCGLHDNIWLGLSDRKEFQAQPMTFKWVNKAGFNNAFRGQWDTNQPSNVSLGNNCVFVLGTSNYKWRTDACGVERSYICERPRGSCPKGWRSWNGNCYQLNTATSKQMTWTEADRFCKAQGSTLIQIETANERNYMRSLIGPMRTARVTDYWIGLSDTTADSTMKWSDGTLLSQTAAVYKPYWENGQPKPVANLKDCAYIRIANRFAQWTAGYCYNKKAFICEIPISRKLVATPVNVTCAPNWRLFKGNCYLFVTQEKVYKDAVAYCQRTPDGTRATLTSILDEEEQGFISNYLTGYSWIGYDDIKTEKKWQWVDGTATTTFTNWWTPSEPNNQNNEDCAELLGPNAFGKSGAWNDKTCAIKRDFICKSQAYVGAPTTPPPTRPWSPLCGAGWFYESNLNFCYQFNYDLQNYAQARSKCIALGGDLLSIGSVTEQTYVSALISQQTGTDFWLGANDVNREGGWEWSDGSPFRYFNWNSGEPNNFRSREDCAIILTKEGGKWNDYNCNSRSRSLCKKSVLQTTPRPALATTPAPVDCSSPGPMISGDHYIPDREITASSQYDANHGPNNARLDFQAGRTMIPLNTPNKANAYVNVPGLNLMGSLSVTFKVKTCRAAFVALSPTTNSKDRNKYEIVINSGSAGSTTVIREQANGRNLGTKLTPTVLNCNTFQAFWLSWDGGHIKLGSGTTVGQNVLVDYADPSPYSVSTLSVMTTGGTGQWQISNPYGGRKGAWSARSNNANQWIQADFLVPITVNAIVTQGRSDYRQWVTRYRILYRYDDDSPWRWYYDPPATLKTFTANKDQNTKVTNTLTYPLKARYVRLIPVAWNGHISMRWEILGCSYEECNPEGLVSGPIYSANSALTASSKIDNNHQPFNARLNSNTGWSPSSSADTEYIQINFNRNYRVRGIVTQGRKDVNAWASSFRLQFTEDGKTWQFYQEPYGTTKVFTANKDKNTRVSNWLKSPFVGPAVRLYPRGTAQVAVGLRFDILGCLPGDCQPVALINGPHPVPINRLRASSSWNSNHGPSRSLLNTVRQGGKVGAWASKVNAVGHWIQVDLGIPSRITGVGTQGRQDYNQWVKTYSVAYSFNGTKWVNYGEGGKKKVFTGNRDRNTLVKNYFKWYPIARYVRLYPATWQGHMSLRWEVYGCPSPSASQYMGCFNDKQTDRDLANGILKGRYVGTWFCTRHCYETGYVYAALQGGNTCLCGNSYGKHGPSAMCNKKCSNNKDMCGGSYVNSVWSTGLAPHAERCGDGWTEFGDSCYQASTTKVTWPDARAACQKLGGELVSIQNAAEQAFVSIFVRNAKVPMWNGFNDLQQQMNFEWSSSAPVTYTLWNTNQPDNNRGRKQDCVLMVVKDGSWDDVVCDVPNAGYVCEKGKEVFDSPRTTPTPKGCDDGWKAYSYSCYYFVPFLRNWANAQRYCKNFGATLVRVNDNNEQAYLTSQLGSSFSTGEVWTDLSDSATPGTYKWSDGYSSIPYTNWAKNQPDDRQGQCVVMGTKLNAGLWYDRLCRYSRNFICEKTRKGWTTPKPPTTPLYQGSCPAGWSDIGDIYCYQLNVQPVTYQKRWPEARDDCVDKGGDLASFHNATQVEQLWRQYMVAEPGNYNFWIGLNNRDTNKGYIWSDGTALQYTRWNKGEPNNWQGTENCVEMNKATGLWNDRRCDATRNWVCKLKKGVTPKVVITTPAPQPEGICGSNDWIKYKGQCYYFSSGVNDGSKDWYDSRDFCKAQGADLATIHNQDEQNFLQGQLFNTSRQYMWIGLNELDSTDGYKWADGSAANYFNWGPNEPNDYGGEEKCVAFYIQNTGTGGFLGRGEWNDARCGVRKGFICKKPENGVVATQPPTPPIPASWGCPVGYSSFGNKCYKIFTDNNMNWTAAKSFCQGQSVNNIHFDLVSIADFDEQSVTPKVVLTTPAPQPEGICGSNDWIKYKGQCYYFSSGVNDGSKDWYDSRDFCKAQGADLATIHNQDEQNFLQGQLFNTSRQYMWIGLNELDSTDGYKWADGSAANYFNWGPNEPNDYGGEEKCVAFYIQNTGTGGFLGRGEWNDARCGVRKGFICKKPENGVVATQPPTPPIPASWGCPVGYSSFGNKCYKIFTDNNMNWTAAKSFCQGQSVNNIHFDLVSIADFDEQMAVTSLLKNYKGKISHVWIGLSYEGTNGQRQKQYYWSDNSPLRFTYWDKGEPNGQEKEPCVEMYIDEARAGRWNDKACSPARSFMCSTRRNSKWPVSTPSQKACADGWYPYGQSCYLVVQQAMGWDQANAECKNRQGTLTSITSIFEQGFIYSYKNSIVKYSRPLWLGLHVGRLDHRYSWADQRPVLYTNWDTNEPSEKTPTEGCVMFNNSGKWSDVACNQQLSFVCKSTGATVPATCANTADKACSSAICSFQCPSGCSASTASVWGTGVYTDDSSICRAAIHDGRIPASGGQVTISKTRGGTRFSGSVKNGITSKSYGAWPGAFEFLDPDQPPYTLPPMNGTCPDTADWVPYSNGYCYLFRTDASRSWSEADYECSRLNGKLITLHSEDETSFVVAHFSVKTTGSSWGGLVKDLKGGWGWKSGEPLDYVNWNDGEPNDYRAPDSDERENCMELVRSGKWNDLNCFNKRGYVCKTSQISVSALSTLPVGVAGPVTSTLSTLPGEAVDANGGVNGSTSTAGPSTTPCPPGDRSCGVNVNPGNNGNQPQVDSTPEAQVAPVPSPTSVSVGEVAGIVIGTLAVVLIAVFALFYFYRSGKLQGLKTNTAGGSIAFDNPANVSYSKNDNSLSIGSPGSSDDAFENPLYSQA